jgi:hypothetical protein
VISYLFFLKNENEYVSVRPKQYRDSLLKLGVEDRDLPSDCSWRGYRRLNDIMKEIQCFLKKQMHDESISLLDAQSFFWMMHRVNGGGNHA